MPCPHNEITIVQRSQRQSAVAAAAYQSGEKLFCEYDQQVKHYPEKRGIVHNEILLPANAPRSYADRNTLWNAAEAVEKQWNSQLARRWVLTIPREIPPDQYAVLVREFCEQQFVSKGIDKVRLSDAKAWLIKLQQVDGRGYSSINALYYVDDPVYYGIQNFLVRMMNNIQFLSSGNAAAMVGSGMASLPSTGIRMALAVVGVLPIVVIFIHKIPLQIKHIFQYLCF